MNTKSRDGKLWIAMPPNPAWLKRIRSVEGRQWHGIQRWSIPAEEGPIQQFIKLFKEIGVDVQVEIY
ncbi:hypothetical protein M3647_01485 [Paenibacillus cellulositrophicus]|uniref:hypothetical protein n=1 Tax=Paenibacillus cellulositrophicus TaxID=562959 RepID=UPI002040D084|nr:hypothetical protein [Paenibacillus cellulositrophicus]MCM2996139.1 hypothetical protein [Paenibacillus cellulositrophicus]